MLWRAVVRRIGGIYEFGSRTLAIHDHGVFLAKDQVIQWEWPKRDRPIQSRAERMAAEDRQTLYR